jgi:hypothetical protein
MHRGEKNTFKFLVGKHEKKPLRRTRHKWPVNIKEYLHNKEFGDPDWIRLAYCIE